MTTPSDPSLVSFAEAPLEALLLGGPNDDGPLVHDMSPEQLAEYVKRCALLRSSAQTRKAEIVKAAGGKKPSAKKSSVDLALELLLQIKTPTK